MDLQIGDIVYVYDSYVDSVIRARIIGFEQRHYVLTYLQFITRDTHTETQARGTTKRYGNSIWKSIEDAWMAADAIFNNQ